MVAVLKQTGRYTQRQEAWEAERVMVQYRWHLVDLAQDRRRVQYKKPPEDQVVVEEHLQKGDIGKVLVLLLGAHRPGGIRTVVEVPSEVHLV